jgi:hypothetical protein
MCVCVHVRASDVLQFLGTFTKLQIVAISSVIFYISLTVHLGTIRVNNKLDALF